MAADFVLVVVKRGESKVWDFYVALGVKKDILRFQVPVDNPIRVQIVKSFDNVTHNAPNVVFCEGSTSKDLFLRVKVHDLALLSVFVDQIDMSIAFAVQKLTQTDHVRVVHALEDLYFVQ